MYRCDPSEGRPYLETVVSDPTYLAKDKAQALILLNESSAPDS